MSSSSYSIESIGQHSRRPYRRLSEEERRELVREVFINKLSICRAADKLGINNSTAKVVIRNYKQSFKARRQRERPQNPPSNHRNAETTLSAQEPTPSAQVQVYYIFVPVANVVVAAETMTPLYSEWITYN